MAAAIALTRADVVVPDAEPHTGVALLVRNNTATLRKGRDVVAQREGVTSVQRTARRQWTITFKDGTVWVANRLAGACCGGR